MPADVDLNVAIHFEARNLKEIMAQGARDLQKLKAAAATGSVQSAINPGQRAGPEEIGAAVKRMQRATIDAAKDLGLGGEKAIRKLYAGWDQSAAAAARKFEEARRKELARAQSQPPPSKATRVTTTPQKVKGPSVTPQPLGRRERQPPAPLAKRPPPPPPAMAPLKRLEPRDYYRKGELPARRAEAQRLREDTLGAVRARAQLAASDFKTPRLGQGGLLGPASLPQLLDQVRGKLTSTKEAALGGATRHDLDVTRPGEAMKQALGVMQREVQAEAKRTGVGGSNAIKRLFKEFSDAIVDASRKADEKARVAAERLRSQPGGGPLPKRPQARAQQDALLARAEAADRAATQKRIGDATHRGRVTDSERTRRAPGVPAAVQDAEKRAAAERQRLYEEDKAQRFATVRAKRQERRLAGKVPGATEIPALLGTPSATRALGSRKVADDIKAAGIASKKAAEDAERIQAAAAKRKAKAADLAATEKLLRDDPTYARDQGDTKADKARQKAAADAHAERSLATDNIYAQRQGEAKADKSRQSARANAAHQKSLAADSEYAEQQVRATAAKKTVTAKYEQALAIDQEYIQATAAAARAKREGAARQKLADAGEISTGLTGEEAIARSAIAERAAADRNAARAARLTTKEDIDAAARRKVSETQLNSAIRAREREYMKELAKSGELGGTRWQRGMAKFSTATGKTATDQPTFGQWAGQKAVTSIGYGASALVAGAAFSGIADLAKDANELQTTFIKVKGQLEAINQGGSFDNVRSEIKGIASDSGISAVEVSKFAQRLIGVYQGDVPKAMKDTTAAMKLSVVAGIDVGTMMESVVPIAKAFSIGIEEIGDLSVGVADEYGIMADEFVQFAGKAAVVSKESGLGLRELSIISSNMAKELGTSIEASAETFNKMPELIGRNQEAIYGILRSGGPKAAAYVKQIQDELSKGRPGQAAIKLFEATSLTQSQGGLSEEQKKQLAGEIAVNREVEQGTALIKSGGQITKDLADPNLLRGENVGKLERRFKDLSDTSAQTFKRISRAFEDLAETIYSSGISDTIATIGGSFEFLVGSVSLLAGAFKDLNNATKIDWGPVKIPEGALATILKLGIITTGAAKGMSLLNGLRGQKAVTSTAEKVDSAARDDVARSAFSAASAIEKQTLSRQEGVGPAVNSAKAEQADAIARGRTATAAGVGSRARFSDTMAALNQKAGLTPAAAAAATAPGARPFQQYRGVPIQPIPQSAAMSAFSTPNLIPGTKAYAAAAAAAAPAAGAVTSAGLPVRAAKQAADQAAKAAIGPVTQAATSAAVPAAATAATKVAVPAATSAVSAAAPAALAGTAPSAAAIAAANAASAAKSGAVLSEAVAASEAEKAAIAKAAAGFGVVQKSMYGGRFLKSGAADAGAKAAGRTVTAKGVNKGQGMLVAAMAVAGASVVKDTYDSEREKLDSQAESYRESLKNASRQDLDAIANHRADFFEAFSLQFFGQDLPEVMAQQERTQRDTVNAVKRQGVIAGSKELTKEFTDKLTDQSLSSVTSTLNTGRTDVREDFARKIGLDVSNASTANRAASTAAGVATVASLGLLAPTLLGVDKITDEGGVIGLTRESLPAALKKAHEISIGTGTSDQDKAERKEAQDFLASIDPKLEQQAGMDDLKAKVDKAIKDGDFDAAVKTAGGGEQYVDLQLQTLRENFESGKISLGSFLTQAVTKAEEIRAMIKSGSLHGDDLTNATARLAKFDREIEKARDEQIFDRQIEASTLAAEMSGSNNVAGATLDTRLAVFSQRSPQSRIEEMPKILDELKDKFSAEVDAIADPVARARAKLAGFTIPQSVIDAFAASEIQLNPEVQTLLGDVAPALQTDLQGLTEWAIRTMRETHVSVTEAVFNGIADARARLLAEFGPGEEAVAENAGLTPTLAAEYEGRTGQLKNAEGKVVVDPADPKKPNIPGKEATGVYKSQEYRELGAAGRKTLRSMGDRSAGSTADAITGLSGYFNESADGMADLILEKRDEWDVTLEEAAIRLIQERKDKAEEEARLVGGIDEKEQAHLDFLQKQLDEAAAHFGAGGKTTAGAQTLADKGKIEETNKSNLELRDAAREVEDSKIAWGAVLANGNPVMENLAELQQAQLNAVRARTVDETGHNAGEAAINAADQEVVKALQQGKRNADDIQDSALQVQSALANGDPVLENMVELELAVRKAARARADNAGEAAVNAADADVIKAQQGGVKNMQAIEASKTDIQSAIFERDPVKAAEIALDQARVAENDAIGEAAKNQAIAQRIRAEHGLEDALSALVGSRVDLAIAMADAAGDTVKVAELQVQEAERRLQEATARGASEAELNPLKTALVGANANLFRTRLSEEQETIDFMLEMGKITISQALDGYRNLLSTTQEGTDEYRSLMRAIKNLENQASADYQFNLPTTLGLPTLYEARRVSQTSTAGIGYQDNRNVVVSIAINGAQDPALVAQQVSTALQGSLRGGSTYTGAVPMGAG